MGIELKGFDEFEKRLEKIGKDAEALNGQRVSFAELFTEPFMREHSKFSSIEELVESGGYSTDAEEFKKIPDDEFDQFIKSSTDFDSWQDMKQAAANAYALKKLGF